MAQIKGIFGLYSTCLVGKARRFKMFISFRFQATRWLARGNLIATQSSTAVAQAAVDFLTVPSQMCCLITKNCLEA